MRVLVGLAIVLLAGLVGDRAEATTLTLTSVDQGWYNSDFGHNPANLNYAAGGGYANFFVFDLSTLSSPISSATLVLPNPGGTGGLYNSYDVSTSIGTLVSAHSPGVATDAIYADLSSGTVFASTWIAAGTSTSPSTNHVVLNSNGLVALNGAIGGLWALGGNFVAPAPGQSGSGFAFGNTGGALGAGTYSTVNIIVTTASIPEPSTLLLLGTGLVMVGIKSRRQTNRRLRS